MTDRSSLLAQLGSDRIMAHQLREILHYDCDTGVFTWLVHRSRKAKPGFVAGTKQWQGYIHIGIDRKYYGAHRLAWLWMTGEWPPQEIDHINCVRDDNRWCNLRLADQTQQAANRSLARNNLVGVKGVTWKQSHNKWHSRIRHKGKLIHLGYFSDIDQASAAYINKARELYGEFANGG